MLTPHLQQLAYLDAVARHGTFGDAADAMGVSQSALSQGLARLEQMAGVALFEADGRRRRLTDAGEEMVAYAERVLADTEEMERRLEDRRRGGRGMLRVGMIDAAVLHHYPTVVTRFRDDHPDVEVHITVAGSSLLLERLHRFEDDVVVVVAPADEGEWIHLLDEPLHVYGPPLPDDLADTRWVLYPSGSHTRAIIEQALVRAGVQPEVVAESGNPAVQGQLVSLGMGWTVLPETAAHGLQRRGEQLAARSLVAVRRPAAPHDPLVAELVAACEATGAEHPAARAGATGARAARDQGE